MNLNRKTELERRLNQGFAPEYLEIIDESQHHIGHAGAQGGGSHFAIDIISKQFTGLSLIHIHRLIYAKLSDLIPHEIHALKIQARDAQ